MYDWTVLDQSVSETLATGRVGTPLFVRWTAAVAQNRQDLKPLLAAMRAYAASWLAAEPSRLYATGSVEDGHISLSLEFENGASALLAVALSHDSPTTNLIVLGARGTVYLTDSDLLSSLQVPPAHKDTGPGQSSGSTSLEILAAIDQSLTTNQPVRLPTAGVRT